MVGNYCNFFWVTPNFIIDCPDYSVIRHSSPDWSQ